MTTGRTKLTGVAGYPAAHSKSPLIHGWWLKKYGIDGVYMPLEIKPGDFHEVLRALPKMGFSGVNVTVPHKTAALQEADELSPEALKAGAVNTVVIREDGTLYGHNTDGFGFLANIAESAGTEIRRSTAVILGTGGASRGICAALSSADCPEIRLVYRTREKAERLAAEVGGNFKLVPWAEKEEALEGAGLLANATTLGMDGFEPLDIDLSALPASAVVSDLVYSPLKTDLLRRAEERGNPTADGLGMLLHQARPAFKAWFGIMPDITDELRALAAGGKQ